MIHDSLLALGLNNGMPDIRSMCVSRANAARAKFADLAAAYKLRVADFDTSISTPSFSALAITTMDCLRYINVGVNTKLNSVT